MRRSSSTYAPRPPQAIQAEREQMNRLAADRAERQRDATERLDEETLRLLTLYQSEKARAARQGKPVLTTRDEWQGRPGMNKQSTETEDA